MSKILKNTTSSNIDIFNLGITVPASDQIDLETSEYILLASPDVVAELTPLINSGDIIINDGIDDLIASEAIAYIQFPDNALNIRFDNSSNGFASKEVQSAIEEAKIGGRDFNIVDAGVFRTSRLFSAYNSQNSQTISGTPNTVQINTLFEGSDSGSYTLSSGELEFLDETESLLVSYSVTFDNTNGTRTSTQSFLEKFDGSSWTKIIGSDVYTYERTTVADRQTGSKSIVVKLNKFNKLRIRSQTIGGSNNTTVAQGSSITIEPASKEAGSHFNLGLDCKTVLEQDNILANWNCGEL
jgi:hypothetical protein